MGASCRSSRASGCPSPRSLTGGRGGLLTLGVRRPSEPAGPRAGPNPGAGLHRAITPRGAASGAGAASFWCHRIGPSPHPLQGKYLENRYLCSAPPTHGRGRVLDKRLPSSVRAFILQPLVAAAPVLGRRRGHLGPWMRLGRRGKGPNFAEGRVLWLQRRPSISRA